MKHFLWRIISKQLFIDRKLSGIWSYPNIPIHYSNENVSHYGDVIIGEIASQITSLTIVYSTVYSDADPRKHQSSASLAFVRGLHRGPMNSLHKWAVTRKMLPFDDVIMYINPMWFEVVKFYLIIPLMIKISQHITHMYLREFVAFNI